MKKRAGLRKNENLLQQVRLRDVRQAETFSQQIERLLMQELANEPGTEAVEYKGKPSKPKAETHKGKILIINDAPVGDWLIRWLVKNRYCYAFTDSEHGANALLEREHFDCVIYSHELLCPQTVLSRI